MNTKRQALGKGLNALLSDSNTDITGQSPVPLYNVSEILISQIEANPFQPRENFNEHELEEMVESIKTHGIIQPVTVRKLGYGKYQLIAGERRTRAAIRAGLKKIPAYIRVADDQSMLEMALIENIHRENLNAIEISISYKRLIEECHLTHEDLAQRIGKNRTTITNFLRLLKLPGEIQIAIRDNKISMGHARAMISVEDTLQQLQIMKLIIQDGLSVREVEEMVKYQREEIQQEKEIIPKTTTHKKPERYMVWQDTLAKQFNNKVTVKSNNAGKGEIIFHFQKEEDMGNFIMLLTKQE